MILVHSPLPFDGEFCTGTFVGVPLPPVVKSLGDGLVYLPAWAKYFDEVDDTGVLAFPGLKAGRWAFSAGRISPSVAFLLP